MHWGTATHICGIKINNHSLFMDCRLFVPSNHLNQYRLSIKVSPRNIYKWNAIWMQNVSFMKMRFKLSSANGGHVGNPRCSKQTFSSNSMYLIGYGNPLVTILHLYPGALYSCQASNGLNTLPEKLPTNEMTGIGKSYNPPLVVY